MNAHTHIQHFCRFWGDSRQHFIGTCTYYTSNWRCNKCFAHAFNYAVHIVVASGCKASLFFSKATLNIHEIWRLQFIALRAYKHIHLHTFWLHNILYAFIAFISIFLMHIIQTFQREIQEIDRSSYFPALFMESLFLRSRVYLWAGFIAKYTVWKKYEIKWFRYSIVLYKFGEFKWKPHFLSS